MLVLAPAKVNLTLDVFELRRDGYHEIRSIMQTVSLFDEIVAQEGDGLTVETPTVPVERDLVWRAASAFYRRLGSRPRVHLSVGKKIPSGAGLGGGSSDAAATLRLLNAWHGHPLSSSELSALAVSLGSDVPFFLHGGLALVTGRGEQVSPLPPLPVTYFLVVKPPFELATADVYHAHRGRQRHGHSERFLAGHRRGEWHLGNDLFATAVRLRPELDELSAALSAAGLSAVTMTGSGSALFARVEGREADRATAVAQERGCEVFLVSTVSKLPPVQARVGEGVGVERREVR